ncbi:MAG: VTT domain-containing protein [Bacteroidetes bacterium]|nr:VTT domain-containing protein [Bacteroidota bacterium]
MELINTFFNYFLHLDENLKIILNDYGTWTYAILFCIIFIETGVVIMPFLPGDSLLFVVGSFAAIGDLNIYYVLSILILAAILGDNTNYWIGKYLGDYAVKWKFRGKSLINPKHIEKTERFYEKYGVKTIIMARFIPIVRTFAPFVAGVGEMNYYRFLIFDILGGILWVCICILAGYWFGQIESIKNNFELAVILVLFASTIPLFVGIAKSMISKRKKK